MKTEHAKSGIGAAVVVTAVIVIVLIAAAGYFIFFPSTSTPSSSTSSSTTSKTSNSTSTSMSTTTSTTGPSTSTITGNVAKVYLPAGVGNHVGSLNFSPASISIAAGTTIEFINNDTTSIHNVYFLTMPTGASVAQNPSPNSNTWTNNEYSVTLTVGGAYTYECQYHSGWMQGTITVTGTVTTTSTTTTSTTTTTTTSTSTTSTSTTSVTTTTTSSGPTQIIYLPAGVGSISTLNFSPASVTVAPGTTIEWINNDTTSIHNVYFLTMPTGATISPNPSPNTNLWTHNAFSVTLTVAGTYTYECQYHSGWMQGQIVVS